MGQCPCFGGNFTEIPEEGQISAAGAAGGPSHAAGIQAGAADNADGIQAGVNAAAGIEAGVDATAVIQAGTTEKNRVPKIFSIELLSKATDYFSIDSYVTEGGSSVVFKGNIRCTGEIAVKQLKGCDGNKLFDHEVYMLSRLQHTNIVGLIGCYPRDRMLVYKYYPLRSLYDQLHDVVLDWDTRMKIMCDIAKVLSYLHSEAKPSVIYGGINSKHILLDDDYQPKISNFTYAQALDDSLSAVKKGCAPYLAPEHAPEHALAEKLSPKSDVYGFGVLLVEIITCNIPLDDTFHRYVADWVMKDVNFIRVANEDMDNKFPVESLNKAMTLAALCMNVNPSARPDMLHVVQAMRYLASEWAEWPTVFNSNEEYHAGPLVITAADTGCLRNGQRNFSLSELAQATNQYNEENVIREGPYGRTYRGTLGTGEVVMIKRLSGLSDPKVQAIRLMHTVFTHPIIAKLIGACVEGGERLLVYPFMPLGTLYTHLHGNAAEMLPQPLDWNRRLNIAEAVGSFLGYLHLGPLPTIFLGLSSQVIYLDDGLNPKIAEFEPSANGPELNDFYVRVLFDPLCMDPNCLVGGRKVTFKSDVYSFGVLLLELLTGRRSMDGSKITSWVRKLNIDTDINLLADPRLEGAFPNDRMIRALRLAVICTEKVPAKRPEMRDVVLVVKRLSSAEADWPEGLIV